MSLNGRKFSIILITALLVFWLSSLALAASMPGMNMDNNSTMTPSQQMAKNQGTAQSGGQPTETPLDQGQQSAMLGAVAGIFIVLPVGTWIILHQRKRRRQSN